MKIKQAVKGNNTFDLSGQHITTTDFGIPSVTNILECVPKDFIKMNVFGECRLAPMPVPTYMDVKLVTRAFFVPFDSIMLHWQDFYRQTKDVSVSDQYKNIPSITNSAIVYAFISDDELVIRQPLSDSETSDFRIGTEYGDETLRGDYFFTDAGRWLYKLLLSLGYSINWSHSDLSSFSCLPMLAYLRVAYDYLYPSQYVESLGLEGIFMQPTAYVASSVFNLLKQVRNLPFKQDYFTAAWKDIQQPGAYYQNPTLDVLGANGDGVQGQSSQTVLLHQNTQSNLVQLSQQGLQLLQRAYEFIQRNNLAGSRYVDRLLAAFGVGSHKFDGKRSVFLDSFEQDVQVVDVTATTSTDSQYLGELAGKGYSQNGKQSFVSFSVPDQQFGYILVLSHVEPRINYYQGRKKLTMHRSRYDFYTPEFDMQMQAIRNDELFADFKDTTAYANGRQYGGEPAGVFGFAPRYSEYKKGESFLTGDFRCRSLAKGLDSYHLFRQLRTPSVQNPLSLSADFLMTHPFEFDRIFAQPSVDRYGFGFTNFGTASLPDDVLTVQGEFVVLRHIPASGTRLYWYIYKKEDGLYSKSFSLPSYLNLAACRVIDVLAYSDYAVQVDIFGTKFLISPSEGPLKSLGGSVVSLSDFLQLYQSYIDHFYIRWIFNIQASRPMQRISDEFMIEDGGEEQNISMNGNLLN